MTSNTEEQAKTEATLPAKEPKGTLKASVAQQARRVAPDKRKSGKKATAAKKSATSGKAGKRAKTAAARQGSKTAKVVELLKRPGGATSKELMKATGWRPHSVRGFLSGTVEDGAGGHVHEGRRRGAQLLHKELTKQPSKISKSPPGLSASAAFLLVAAHS
jgi:hypothetical protein